MTHVFKNNDFGKVPKGQFVFDKIFTDATLFKPNGPPESPANRGRHSAMSKKFVFI